METKGWKKPIIQTLYSGLKNASDFPLLFTLINFFCEPTKTKFSILDNRKLYKKKYETSRNAYKELDLRVRRVSQKIFKIGLSFLIQIKGGAIHAIDFD